MTRFFNQKEEVLQLELTPYGKHKLSNGEMRPVYYAFYDDTVLYDGKLGGIVENQNAIVERIENTPQLTPQTYFKSNDGQQIRTLGLNISDYNELSEANSKFFKVIGDSSPGSSNKPAWKVNNLSGSVGFSGTVSYVSDLSIPSFTSSLDIRYSQFQNEGEFAETVYVLEENDKILLDIEELNTISKNNANFDIEIYRITEAGEGEQIPLGFINGNAADSAYLGAQQDPFILRDGFAPNEQELGIQYPKLNSSYVEYYLSVRVDDEILGGPTLDRTSLYAGSTPNPPSVICDDDDEV